MPGESLRLDHEVSALHSVRAGHPLRLPRLDCFALHLDEVGVDFVGHVANLDGDVVKAVKIVEAAPEGGDVPSLRAESGIDIVEQGQDVGGQIGDRPLPSSGSTNTRSSR